MATQRGRMSNGERAAITKVAGELAAELNDEKKELAERLKLKNFEERDRKRLEKAKRDRAKGNAAQQRRRRIARNGHEEDRHCLAYNLVGNPCKQPPLIPERWEGDEEVSGDYCWVHDPSIGDERRRAFQLGAREAQAVARRVTPGEIAAELVERAPKYFLDPYLEALGLTLNEETGEIEKTGPGLVLHGFSRGGEVKRSRYPDLVGQQHTVERLMDRIYGKARQAMDISATGKMVTISVPMDADRVEKVLGVLQQAGAFPNGDVIDSTAEEMD